MGKIIRFLRSWFSAKQNNSVKETIIKSTLDQDFGRIDLVETSTSARVNDGPWKSVTFKNWMAKQTTPSGENFLLLLDTEMDPPNVNDSIRRLYRDILASLPRLKEKIAVSQLELARSWIEQSDHSLPIDATILAKSLSLCSVSVKSDGLIVSFLDDLDIFAGHELTARLNERGETVEISIC